METAEVVMVEDDGDIEVEEVNAAQEDAEQLLVRARAGVPAAALELEQALVQTVNTLGEIAETTCVFSSQEMNDTLRTLVARLVEQLTVVMKCAEALENEVHMRIPVDIVLGVDLGKNPYACALQLLENLAEKDAQLTGKRKVFNVFSATLSEYVQQVTCIETAATVSASAP